MAYKVVQAFTDLKDGDKVYRVGDIYEGTDETRIEELVSTESKGRHESLKGKHLIELDGKTPEVPEVPEVPEDEVKAPKKGKK